MRSIHLISPGLTSYNIVKPSFKLKMCAHVSARSLQSCLTLYNPMDYSSPGSSVHGIFHARILEWVAMPSSRGSSRLRGGALVPVAPVFAGRFFIPES